MKSLVTDKKKLFRLLILITGISALLLFNNFSKRFDQSLKSAFNSASFNNSADTNIVLIKITNSNLAQLGNWPLRRDYYAMLIESLTEYKPKAIGFEVFLSGSSPEQTKYDSLLHSAISKTDRSVLSSLVLELNSNSTNFNADSIIYPPLKLKYDEIKTGHLNYIEKHGLHIPTVVFVNGKSEKCFALELLSSDYQIDASMINLNLQYSWNDYPSYSLVDFFNLHESNKIDINSFKDKYVIIGVADPTLAKSVLTNFDDYLPGLGFHALVLDNLLNKTYWNDSFYLTSIAVFIIVLLLLILLGKNEIIAKMDLFALLAFIILAYISTNILFISLAFSAFLIPFFLLLIFEIYLFFNTTRK